MIWFSDIKVALYDDYVCFLVQLVRRLEGQDDNASGDEVSTTPKKIFQLVTQVLMIFIFIKVLMVFICNIL